MELIPVNIVIGDRSYRIKVSAADEEQVRKTVKTINDKILEFKTMFAGKDMQDYVAMVLVWYATETSSGNNIIAAETDQTQASAAIIKLEQIIDQLLVQP
ncbi:MAG: cell division protein ZapA [Chitinophagaceae bacterium]|jgi:cell division protein ZapA (FtsZ GTPase activity inhibitor)|nr:cell division protein ZapA [Chitinophagaceae bacterium]